MLWCDMTRSVVPCVRRRLTSVAMGSVVLECRFAFDVYLR